MPKVKPVGWTYQGIDDERHQLLMDETSFTSLVADVLAGVAIEGLTLNEECNEAKRIGLAYKRVGIELGLPNASAAEAADRLLNGAYGLRAHYCRSPELGAQANAAFCQALGYAIRNQALTVGCRVSSADMQHLPEALGDSLCKPSAKVWFDSATDRRAVAEADGTVSSVMWAQSSANPLRVRSLIPNLTPQQIESALIKGRSIPRPLGLEVKAAFVAPNREEFVPASKRTRSLQIHLLGWT